MSTKFNLERLLAEFFIAKDIRQKAAQCHFLAWKVSHCRYVMQVSGRPKAKTLFKKEDSLSLVLR